ncbi:hypothetical protein LCGC14_0386380 [marine sediment metagenome]|uniref:DNA cytosine methyltransferase n=1 Tax=marine sediment metagenome TaxID=412755 RepID=A0A0F9T6S6_9ZZZZ
MKVLVACEFSGVVRDAFARRGHDAWSCDLEPSEAGGSHLQFDVRDAILDWDWDLMIAHPPCPYLSRSGVRWLYEQPGRWELMREAAQFFKALWEANIPKIAIENPIPHRYGIEPLAGRYSQIIQPWQFGHGEVKATCLWLKGLPLLEPTNVVDGRVPRVHYEGPGKDRWKNRSRTYYGIAEAMAEQWGGPVTT